MAQKKYVLPTPETLTVSTFAADKLIRAGDGDAALLYLYILKNHGAVSQDDASAALGQTAEETERAFALLAKLGLVNDAGFSPASAAVKDELPEYTAEDVKREIANGSAFSSLVKEVQKKLGKILSSDELLRLFGIYDSIGMPPEVILVLLTYCMGEAAKRYGPGRMPTLRYIEKAAYTWERENVMTLDAADEYLKKLEKARTMEAQYKAVLQIRDRELTAGEKKYISSWAAMGFEAEAVELAYDKTVMNTGKLTWKYMDTILRSWDAKGLYTAKAIDKGDTRGRKPRGEKTPAAPSAQEMESMKKMLEKMRQG